MNSYDIVAQEMPSDSLLLKTIFGTCDRDGKGYTRDYITEDEKSAHHDNLTYSIIYKKFMNIQNQNVLLVILEAPIFYTNSKSGYIDYYYFKKRKNQWRITKSFIDYEFHSLSDDYDFELVDIGKNKKALKSQILGTGQQHLSINIELNYFLLDSVKLLLRFESVYDDVAWKGNDVPENKDCEAVGFRCSYNINKNDNEWFDINVHKFNYTFSKGCKEEIINSEQKINYRYNGIEYIETKK